MSPPTRNPTRTNTLYEDTAAWDQIKELLDIGLSVRKIAKYLGYTNHIGLNLYINKRHIRSIISIKP